MGAWANVDQMFEGLLFIWKAFLCFNPDFRLRRVGQSLIFISALWDLLWRSPLILLRNVASNTAGCKLNGKKNKKLKKIKKNLGQRACKSMGDERWEFQRGLWLFELENGWDKYSQRLRCPYCKGGYFPCRFMDNYMPTGDAKSLYERECNEGRYKRSHQKEYLKWDLQESKDLLGKIDCSYSGVPQVVVFSLKLLLLLRWAYHFP